MAAWLQGREMQAQRTREEEEKARELERWLYSKMQSEKAADLGERQFGFEQQQAEAARIRAAQELAARQSEGAAERASAEKIAGMRAAGGQEQERPLYDKQGFNGEVALWLAMGNLGVKTDMELAQLLSGPQGQALAEGLVNRLASVHGWRYPERNLSTDFWSFLKVRNPNLKSPSDMAAATAAQQQVLAQQQAERERQQQERARLGALPAQMPQLPQVGAAQPQTPAALQQALVSGVSPFAILGSPGAAAAMRPQTQAPQPIQALTPELLQKLKLLK